MFRCGVESCAMRSTRGSNGLTDGTGEGEGAPAAACPPSVAATNAIAARTRSARTSVQRDAGGSVPRHASPLITRDNARMLINGREVAVTNPDKVYFPKDGITKGDLVQYYVDVAQYALNHVQRRPMQMKRHPNGVDGDFFYQKRIPNPHPDWLETIHIQYPSGNEVDFPVVTDAAGLAWIANLGCIEMHTWHSRVPEYWKPDYMLLDLDPREAGDTWEGVREIAMVVKAVLDDLKLPSYPKTSGSTGIHILTPIVPELPFPEVRRLAKAIANLVAERIPLATTTWVVKDRTGVFVDYGQNAFDRTIASAYSIRPVPEARASTPLRWDEVPDVDHNDFTLRTMRDRIAKVGDLTADIWANPVSLLGLFKTLKLKDPVIDDRVLVKPSRMAKMSEEERKEMFQKAKASGWNKGTSRWPPKPPKAAKEPKEPPSA
jgi:bifunctional non-homologous end joining protein LigD